MVEYPTSLNLIFYALSDPIRRDILERVACTECSVGELVAYHHVSFSAVSKHLRVLAEAGLVSKRKDGRKQMVSLAPEALSGASQYLGQYHQARQGRHDYNLALARTKTE